MPLFICEKCHCIENTATSMFWSTYRTEKPNLCSECDTGEWHGRFKKRICTKEILHKNKDSFVYGTWLKESDVPEIQGEFDGN